MSNQDIVSSEEQEEVVSQGSEAGCVKLPRHSLCETGFELASSGELLKQR
jgi:hypothetical protein